jgi:RNA polymerase sigma-32 factor
MKKALVPPLALDSGNLEAYQQAVAAIPMLSAEEERHLVERYRQDHDLDAAWHLVMAHLRFVVRIARGYRGYGLPQEDLIQEGNIGLMKAVKRFDPAFGVRLVSFAVHWVRAEIHEFILRNWRIVKMATTKAQRTLFFNLRRAKKGLEWMSRQDVDAISRELGVKEDVVLDMEQRLAGHDAAFDGAVDEEDETDRRAPAGYLQDMRFDPATITEQSEWEAKGSERLRSALGELDKRSREILQRRWLNEDKTTLQELAQKYNISAERVRQLENNALKQLRHKLT